jgi:histidinol-phosphate aminotransferase
MKDKIEFITGKNFYSLDLKRIINNFDNFNYSNIENDDLKKTISKHYKVDNFNVCLGNGSSELIESIIYNYSDILLLENDFYLFEEFSKSLHKNVLKLKTIDLDLKLEDVNKKYLFIFSLISNETGIEVDLSLINEFADKNKDVDVFIDGAYREYSSITEDDIKNILKVKNISYIGTFSKAYGISGLRVGYLIHDNIIKDKRPYKISNFSAFIANNLMKDKKFLENNIKTFLLEAIKFTDIGFKIKNHKLILNLNNEKALFLYNELIKNEMKVKIISEGISVSMGKHEHNDKLINFIGINNGK